MIITKKPKTETLENREYPYLGLGVEDTSIVLFTRRHTGVCLAAGKFIKDAKCQTMFGEYSNLWNEKEFRVYEGQLILEN